MPVWAGVKDTHIFLTDLCSYHLGNLQKGSRVVSCRIHFVCADNTCNGPLKRIDNTDCNC